MKSTISIIAIICLLTSTQASFDNVTLDSGSLDSEILNTVLIGKTAPSSPLALIRRAFSLGDKTISKREECPKVWYTIAEDFKREFSGCSRKASSSIRFSFHDAGGYSSKNTPYPPASGGADGSLLLNDEEIARDDHNPMQGFRAYLLAKWETYKDEDVSAADFVQAAGNIGVRSCLGPVVKTLVGREDSSEASPEGTLPPAFGQGADHASLVQLFADKGISPRELAALMGAHTVSRSFANVKNGMEYAKPQDNTPRVWDNRYFSQTQKRSDSLDNNIASFQSDVNLASPNTTVGGFYTEFGENHEAWEEAFTASMLKLSLLGLSEDKVAGLVDCTEILRW